ncbi:hypothetical protein Droror1_Dr00003701 [Drosera rotundifolia]
MMLILPRHRTTPNKPQQILCQTATMKSAFSLATNNEVESQISAQLPGHNGLKQLHLQSNPVDKPELKPLRLLLTTSTHSNPQHTPSNNPVTQQINRRPSPFDTNENKPRPSQPQQATFLNPSKIPNLATRNSSTIIHQILGQNNHDLPCEFNPDSASLPHSFEPVRPTLLKPTHSISSVYFSG